MQSPARFYVAVSWRNLWRHRRRTLITSAAMGLGVAMCMAYIALADGMYAQMMDVWVKAKLGHVQLHHPDYPGAKRAHDTVPDALVAEVAALPGVETVAPRVFAFALAGGAETSSGAQLIGVAPGAEAQLTGLDERVANGAWLAETAELQAVVGVDLARDLEVGVGDELVLVGQDAVGGMANELFTVVGLVRSGQTGMDRSGVWLHKDDLQTFLAREGQLHEVLIAGDSLAGADQLRDAVLAATTAPTPAPLLVRTWEEADPLAAQMMGMQDASAAITLSIVLSVAGLGILNTMLMSVFERMREFGVLRALGLSPRQLVVLVLTESLLLATVATGFGLVMGGGLDALLVTHGIEFSVDGKGLSFAGVTLDPVIKGVVRPQGIVLTVVAVYTVTLVAAVWPALRAARLEPVAAMRET